jgi:hypothetical protein
MGLRASLISREILIRMNLIHQVRVHQCTERIVNGCARGVWNSSVKGCANFFRS